MKRLFIINPKSGKGKGCSVLPAVIKQYFPNAELAFTEHQGHARQLAYQAVQNNYNQVIVAGGDGTINEAVQSIVFSQTVLGVIPLGSGNGLAREFGVPLDNLALACNNIPNAEASVCDVGRINGDYFINLAGIGIEADIAHKFDAQGKTGNRGKWPYFKIGMQEVLHYKPAAAQIVADGQAIKTTALTIVFANGRQYGSGFKIAPDASFCDGYLDMVIMPKANILKLLLALPNFFKAGISPIKSTIVQRVRQGQISIKGAILYHIDGEPKKAQDKLDISICPGAIKVLRFKK